jgi:hypothetical protein
MPSLGNRALFLGDGICLDVAIQEKEEGESKLSALIGHADNLLRGRQIATLH